MSIDAALGLAYGGARNFNVIETIPGLQMQHTSKSASVIGVVYAVHAFLIWGLSPIYWKTLVSIPALEITMHRVVWSLVFLLPLIIILRQLKAFVSVLKDRRTLLVLLLTSIIITGNWFLYIWAVNNNYLLQASLGYYMNPLVNVVLGLLFLKERLRFPQALAVLIASGAVLFLTLQYGEFPWIALTFAVSFGFYGLIRKVAPVGALVGLTMETLLFILPAVIYLMFLKTQGSGYLFQISLKMNLLLILTGPMTAAPLLFFTLAARRLNLSTLGLMQYIAPSGIFLLAVLVYHEPFSMVQVWTFIMIWTALTIFSIDSVLHYRQHVR